MVLPGYHFMGFLGCPIIGPLIIGPIGPIIGPIGGLIPTVKTNRKVSINGCMIIDSAINTI